MRLLQYLFMLPLLLYSFSYSQIMKSDLQQSPNSSKQFSNSQVSWTPLEMNSDSSRINLTPSLKDSTELWNLLDEQTLSLMELEQQWKNLELRLLNLSTVNSELIDSLGSSRLSTVELKNSLEKLTIRTEYMLENAKKLSKQNKEIENLVADLKKENGNLKFYNKVYLYGGLGIIAILSVIIIVH